jgi:hypothetical protein
MLFDNVLKTINLTKDEKRFLKTREQQHGKGFLEKFADKDFLYINNKIYKPD